MVEGRVARNAACRAARACFAAAALIVAAHGVARAQHATAYDIEDGGRAYEASCANCHGPDGDLIPGIDFGRGVYRSPLSDAGIAAIIMNGLPGTPMPATPDMSEEQALRIVAYLRSMAAAPAVAAAGDPVRGREIFMGKGGCLDCHRVAGRGARVGPDLSSIGLVRRASELEASLLDPAAEVQPENRWYEATTARGERIEGRLLNHDMFTVQLIDRDGRLRSLDKGALASHGFAATPMPAFGDELDAAEIADLVSYLTTLLGESEP